MLNIYINPTQGPKPLVVNFSGTTGLINPVYIWNFDDSGITATGTVANHTYTNSGIYHPSVVASGLAQSGSYIYDDYSNGSISGWWGSQFDQYFNVVTINGTNVVTSSGDFTSIITPSGFTVTGDFFIESSIWWGSPQTGNVSEHLMLFASGTTTGNVSTSLVDLYYNANTLYWAWTNLSTKDSLSMTPVTNSGIDIKIERIGNTITGYWKYKHSGTYTAFANPYTNNSGLVIGINGSNCNYTGPIYIESTNNIFPSNFTNTESASGTVTVSNIYSRDDYIIDGLMSDRTLASPYGD